MVNARNLLKFVELLQKVIKLAQLKRMHIGFKMLSSELHLHTAAIEQTPILVFIGAELIGSGTIDVITEEFIKISGEYYLRESCTFTYSK